LSVSTTRSLLVPPQESSNTTARPGRDCINDGLPSNDIRCMTPVGASVFIGTDKGSAASMDSPRSTASADQPPTGVVTAVGGESNLNVFAVVDNDLYHFDALRGAIRCRTLWCWKIRRRKIAAKFSLYGTAAEREQYRTKLLKSFDIPKPADSGAVVSDSV